MKAFLALVFTLGLFVFTACAQQDADESYLAVYGLMQQGDTLAANGQVAAALDDYQQALNSLNTLHNGYPDWNPNIVQFRQKYLAQRIESLRAQLPTPGPSTPTPVTPAPAPSAPSASATTAAAPAGSAPSDWADQLAAARQQLQTVQADNAALAAKLKEALAVQPAAVDPAQLESARTQARELLKQIDVLKASLADTQKQLADQPSRRELARLNHELEHAQKQIAKQQKAAAELTAANETQIKQLLADKKSQKALHRENEFLTDQLADATNRVTQLTRQLTEAQAAQAKLTAAQKDLEPARRAQEKLERLKQELAAAKTNADHLQSGLNAESDLVESLQKQLKAATKEPRSMQKLKKQLADVQAEAQAAEADRQALQERLRELQSAPVAAGSADAADRLKELTRERDDLLAQLGEANRKLAKEHLSTDDTATQMAQLNNQLADAQSKLAALTLTSVPYTPEELALFSAPAPAAAASLTASLPPGSADLMADAQKHFANHEFAAAAADYQKILARQTNNFVVLGNLAAIEIEAGQLDSAETHLYAALAQAPADGYTLTQLGNLQLREQHYDDAVTTLGRAVQLNAGPDALNLLGVTLSHQGLRPQAEAALRKALVLNPNFGPAHLNLANVYLDAQPPAPQLARWHYQKALAAGQAPSPAIEKQLADLGAPLK